MYGELNVWRTEKIMGKFSGFKLAVILTAFVAVFFMTLSDKFTFLEFVELKTLDMRFKIRGEMASSQDVGIAVIDDQRHISL